MFSRNAGFRNWTGNQRCLPEAIENVSATEQVAAIVTDAHRRRSRVKAVGSAHSFTSAAMTDGTLTRLDGFDAIESFDSSTGVVTVGAGIRLCDLNRSLDEIGRALPNLGDIDVQTIAGATATATHGTGAALGNLSSGIVGFELVTGTGDVLWCDESTNAEVWRVGRVSIGALGVITRVALATVPAFRLRAVEGPGSVAEVLDDWPGFVASARHAEFFCLAGGDECYTKRNDVTTDPVDTSSRRTQFVEQILIENAAIDALMRVNRRLPKLRDRLAATMAGAMSASSHVDISHRIFASPRHVRFMEMEYGIPIDAMPEALARVRSFAESLDRVPLFPIEVRVSAADDIPLSTASGRNSGWIAVHEYRGVPYGDYFRGVEAIMDDYDGRPHWGKYHFQTAATLAPKYPEWDAFQEVRAKVDPSGTFANEYSDRVLGPVGA